MPEDPKNVFRRARKKQELDAAEAAARKEREATQKRIDRQRERRARQPEEGAPESEAAQWVRDNFEWEPYPSLWVPKFASWSDYSGSYVDRANGKALIRDHGDLFEEGHGGHGTVWVGIAEDKRLAMTDEQWEAIKDIIDGLENYPIIDDDLHSEMEMEAKYEYWEEYGREGVREFLTKKFNTVGDVDASIAVAARRNEFWDTMLREHSWDEHLNEEEGGNFYFDEKRALRDVGRDEIVDDDMVEATKKHVFYKSWAGGAASFANELSNALKQANVDVENGHHLWQLLKDAEHVLGAVGVWEVSDRYHSSKAEVDVEDQISLASVEDVVNVLSAPDAHQKMLHKPWAEDPRQLKLPDFEGNNRVNTSPHLAEALAASLLDAESPRQVMQQLPRFKFKIASPGEQVMLQAEEGDSWPIPLGTVIQDPDRKFRIVSGSPTRLGWKWWENVTPEVFALQFDAKDDAAKHLWLIWKRSGQVREAEDPRAVLRMAQDPKGVPKRYIGNMPKEVEIWGKRWFSKTYGNTYFTARIYVDGQQVHFMPEEYGYGDHYRDQSFEWLEDNGYIPKRDRYSNNMPKDTPWGWCEKHGIKLSYHADDVKRRDMFRESEQVAERVMEGEDPKAIFRQQTAGPRWRVYKEEDESYASDAFKPFKYWHIMHLGKYSRFLFFKGKDRWVEDAAQASHFRSREEALEFYKRFHEGRGHPVEPVQFEEVPAAEISPRNLVTASMFDAVLKERDKLENDTEVQQGRERYRRQYGGDRPPGYIHHPTDDDPVPPGRGH